MEKVLITGGCGFIGSNAANILTAEGYKVVAFDNLSLGKKSNLDSAVEAVEGDVQKAEDLNRVGPVDYIIHLASASSAPMFSENLIGSVANNVIGHLEVLEYARRNNVKKVLFASSSSIYGNNPIPLTEDQLVTPPNFYAVTKHSQEELSHVYAQLYNVEIIGFRFMSVYGLHEEHKGRFANLVSQFIWGMEQGKSPVIYGDGSQTRDLVNVKDIVSAFKLALKTPKKFGFTVFNVGTARAIPIRDVIAIINQARGSDLKAQFVENPIRSGYISSQQADLSKIKKELGYQESVTLEEGIAEIVAHRKNNPVPPASLSY
ncbi:MAG TPA: NAD-dependent epimerase/dehydratase family protein [Candidatus Paceibacterota bacterium]|nr:NAD-dependent epimerase/dehydratase family protein [Candidatus Paceibacterota bacterium]